MMSPYGIGGRLCKLLRRLWVWHKAGLKQRVDDREDYLDTRVASALRWCMHLLFTCRDGVYGVLFSDA